MITLSSDFGTPYPAAMKGVILRRTDARLVDIAHDFPRQDPHTAAFWLREVLSTFPPAVHLAVVDPGVGTDRRAIVVRAGEHALVGPDNGLLVPTARRLVDGGRFETFEIVVEDPDSATFHGRDVFAPAAADIHEVGVGSLERIDRFEPIDGAVDLAFPDPTVDAAGGTAAGEVLVVDDFGNVITNVPGDVLTNREEALVNDTRVPVGETFAAVPEGERLVTVGSHGYLECDVNCGRGDEAFGLSVGDAVEIRFDRAAENE
ncbi:SAM hydrolase/SAM-dependent halogenase family protein [Haloferacaceae archaeon DSL9]